MGKAFVRFFDEELAESQKKIDINTEPLIKENSKADIEKNRKSVFNAFKSAKLIMNSFKEAKVTVDGNYAYKGEGKPVWIVPTVKIGQKKLVLGEEFKVHKYENNKKIGTATATIKGVGIYQSANMKDIKFNIVKVNEVKIVDESEKNKLDEINVAKGNTISLFKKIKTSPENISVHTMEFISSNERIVTIDKNGNLKAISDGTAKITVKVGEKSVECKVNVFTPADVKLEAETIKITLGEQKQIIAKKEPINTKAIIKWASKDKDITTVDQNGKIKGINIGKTEITATITNKTTKCTVEVRPPQTKDVFYAETDKGTVKFKWSENKYADYYEVWYSKTGIDGTYTKIKKDITTTECELPKPDAKTKYHYKVTAVKNKIRGKATRAQQSVTLLSLATSKNKAVTGVKLNKTSSTIKKGKTLQLTATITPKNATNKAITYSSSNTKIATVDKNGKVTAKNAGNAVITVTTKSGNKKATCKITVTN